MKKYYQISSHLPIILKTTITFLIILLVLLPFIFSFGTARAGTTLSGTTSTPLPDPLSTPLPTPGPIPISVWRPPLYPVPWSLSQHDHFYFTRPIAADEVNWPLPDYRFGGTYFGPDIPHTGVDIVTPTGTPVMAAGPGQVVFTGFGLFTGWHNIDDPYGKAVAIAHDFGFNNQPLFTIYAHLSEVNVVKGQMVEWGEEIGLSGGTGFSTAPHLHFEVRMGENYSLNSRNPELWLAPPQGWGVLVGRVMNSQNNWLKDWDVEITNLETQQTWSAESYDTEFGISRDPYYNENFVLSDLPAGIYEIKIPYVGYTYHTYVKIFPGAATYFKFQGHYGFNNSLPKLPIPENLPNETLTP